MSKIQFFFITLFLCNLNIVTANAQSVDKNVFSAVMSLNESYQIDIANTYLHSYGEVYLLTSNEPIAPILLALSKEVYSTPRDIFEQLKGKFNVYTVAKNEKELDLFDDLVKIAHYSNNFIFNLDNSERSPQSINSFSMWLREASPFKFTKVNQKCDPRKAYCSVLIRRARLK